MLVTCNCCGKEFDKYLSEIKKTKANYCSKSCAGKINNSLHPKRGDGGKSKTKVCPVCNTKNIKLQTTQCMDCFNRITREKLERMTLKEMNNMPSVKGKHPSWKNANVRNLARAWNKDLQCKPCRICGYSKHVELAHIKSITSFPEDTLLYVINSSSNLIPLCRNCHWEFDSGVLEVTGRIDLPSNLISVLEEKKLVKSKPVNLCSCGAAIKTDRAKTCKGCNRKVDRPAKEVLQEEMLDLNWSRIAKKYGVTGNAVRKWAISYGLI